MNLQSLEFWMVALLVMICVVGGFGLFARWCAFSPAVSRDQLDKMRVGMTTAEIVAVLGQPRLSRWATDKKNLTWTYGASMKRHVLILEFNSQDKMVSFVHGIPGQANRQRNPFPEA